jgi:hypothetical protein
VKAILLVVAAVALAGCSTFSLVNEQTLYRCDGKAELVACPKGESPMVVGVEKTCRAIGTGTTLLPSANCR